MSKTTERQAVALKYDGENAPNLTAKGNDALAEEILQIAREHDVPITKTQTSYAFWRAWNWATPFLNRSITPSLKSLPLHGT